jgi:hypothetical protein
MPDFDTFSAALSSLKTATEIAKFIKDSGVTLDKAEVKLKLAELTSALADTKIELAEIQEVLLEKDKTIRELKARFDLSANVIYENRCYWIVENDQKVGPFCQRCYDADSKLIRLQSGVTDFYEVIRKWYSCRECSNTYDA